MTAKTAFPVFDTMHLLLMLAALGLAYYLPFELVLLSYAILGPLHYMTEISWLHERNYFMARRWLALVLVLCTGVLLLLQSQLMANGMVLIFALAFSAAFVLGKDTQSRFIIVAVSLAIGSIFVRIAPLNISLVVLLPTVIHVSVFTFLFMLVGALRSKSAMQILLVVAYIFCIAIIFVFPPPVPRMLSPDFAANSYKFFGAIGIGLGNIFGGNQLPFDTRLAGFLSFIYTYHYLNWFIKVRVIKWSDVPKGRLALIAILGVAATSLYFIDYTLGLLTLLSLSLLHVVLEFPLNVISIREIARMIMPPSRSATL